MDAPTSGQPPHAPEPSSGSIAHQSVAEVQQVYKKLLEQVHSVVVGQHEVVEQVLIAVLCRGHALLVGVPGLAKTLLVSTLAKSLSLRFSRIQFTPDLMPSDIIGTEVIQEDKSTGARQLRFVKGPIFANVILADEINRTPPKTQAALLEAMQERHVTVGGVGHPLPDPFFVLATQNPIEQEGTYPLPEAQLDRFLFQIQVGYPTDQEELEILRRAARRESVQPEAVLGAEQIKHVQDVVRQTPIAEHVMRYATRLVRTTRVSEEPDAGMIRPASVRNYLGWGAGPRASEALVLAAKAAAVLRGATHVTPEHVKMVAKPILRHRLLLNFNAQADQITADAVIDDLLRAVPVDSSSEREKKQMDSVMR